MDITIKINWIFCFHFMGVKNNNTILTGYSMHFDASMRYSNFPIHLRNVRVCKIAENSFKIIYYCIILYKQLLHFFTKELKYRKV